MSRLKTKKAVVCWLIVTGVSLMPGAAWAQTALYSDDAVQSHTGVLQPARVTHLTGWGTAEHVVETDALYLAGQPDAEGYALAAQAGVLAVINIRQPGEVDWDMAAAVEKSGMQYFNVPLVIDETDGINLDSARAISELLVKLQTKGGDKHTVLVHCASGNRAAAWWALHLADAHGEPVERALVLGRMAGMTKPELVQATDAALQRQKMQQTDD